MASKVKSTAKTPTKASAKKLAVAPAAAVEKLVSKIVTVDETPITTGVKKMTATVENTTETVTAKAKDFFADMQARASVAADKGKKLAADTFEFQKANFAAMLDAGKIVAKGAQEIGKTNVEFAKSNFAEIQAAVKEIAAVRTPTDFVKVQTAWTKKGFDTAVAQGSKNTEAMVKLVSDMFQPISNRIAVTTDLFKKAA
jgi:phasin family protein